MADLDYEAIFQAAPTAAVVMNTDFVILDANRAYLKVSGRRAADLIGRDIFEAFPDNPGDAEADGTANLRASLVRVRDGGERDTMALQKYDVERPDQPGVFEERYWSPVNSPVPGPDGRVRLIIHRVEEVTPFIRELREAHQGSGAMRDPDLQAMESELYARARELQQVIERLREAHAREQQVALSLQQTMLPAITEGQRAYAAVRYLPAVGSLNVCGDWYDIVELSHDRVAVAVGDVVGHGLEAAGVMGQLRSALGAAIRAVAGPAQALEVLERYARSLEDALATTVVQAVIDRGRRVITYSRAGHPPPLLVQPEGTVEILDQVIDPPLAASVGHAEREQAEAHYRPGATFVLYSDGLIERRGQDIDLGLGRLADILGRYGGLDPHTLADKLLADLGAGAGLTDDTALLVIRL